MSRRITTWVFAAIIPILGILPATPADAASMSNPHNVEPHCSAEYFRQGVDEEISLRCTNANDDFQVIAECGRFLSGWQEYGDVAENGHHSTAVCHGLLIFEASVVDYSVIEVSD